MQQDLYFLLRLFINFDEEKMQKGPVGCRDVKYGEIKNAIFYGGRHHTRIYVEFLRKYFKVEPSIQIMGEAECMKCIELDRPFDFFVFE